MFMLQFKACANIITRKICRNTQATSVQVSRKHCPTLKPGKFLFFPWAQLNWGLISWCVFKLGPHFGILKVYVEQHFSKSSFKHG